MKSQKAAQIRLQSEAFFYRPIINQRGTMYEIPFLFIEDDHLLIQMYSEYFDARGYQSVLIRNGLTGFEQAMSEGQSLLTLKAADQTNGENTRTPIYIITRKKKDPQSNFNIIPTLNAGKVFNELRTIVEKNG